MEALVLAAGGGRRFQESGGVGHKGLHSIDGSCALESTVRALASLAGTVTVVTGYARAEVEARLADLDAVSFAHSEQWAVTDSAHSFAIGAAVTSSDLLLVYADTVVVPRALALLADAEGDAVGIDVGRRPAEWDMRASLDGTSIVRLGKHLPLAESHAESSCVYRLSARTVRELELACRDDARQFETVLDERLARGLTRLQAVDITAMWAELDRLSDRDLVRDVMSAA